MDQLNDTVFLCGKKEDSKERTKKKKKGEKRQHKYRMSKWDRESEKVRVGERRKEGKKARRQANIESTILSAAYCFVSWIGFADRHAGIEAQNGELENGRDSIE